MDLATFIAQRENQCLDLDGAYGCQGVDLADAWANNLGPPTATGGRGLRISLARPFPAGSGSLTARKLPRAG